MLCIPIGNCTIQRLLKNLRQASKSADLVEIRADSITGFSLATLLKYKPQKPLIFTCYSRLSGGAFRGTESQRINLLLSAITSGRFEYITIDIPLSLKIPEATKSLIDLARRKKAKIILAYHNYRNTPDNLSAVYRQLAALRPDAVKIVTYAREFSDNFRIFRLARQTAVPPLASPRRANLAQKGGSLALTGGMKRPKLIAFCMGEKGLISRILYRRFGLFLTYASYKQGAQTAEGQIPFGQMKYLYRADSINRRTRIFGLLGNPIEHSYSPILFNALFYAKNISGVYLPFAIDLPAGRQGRKHFKDDFALIKKFLKPEGFSITSPYKIKAMQFVSRLSRSAREIGAINTIYKRGGKYIGTNTDWLGVLETLYQLRKMLNNRPALSAPTFRRRGKKGEVRPRLAPARAERAEGRQALIIGKGGAARAILYVLRNSGIRTTVFARKAGKGAPLLSTEARAPSPQGTVRGALPLSRLSQYCRGSGSDKIIINATPIGMQPDTAKSPVPKTCLKRGMVVFDTIYNPSRTQLLKDAQKKGCITVNGLMMFLVQALKQMECFTHAFRNSKR
ncbi:MAG: type I 3-dehydroquinate dehydratase [Planctomycetota bacterium]